jgi:TPR repeat protein
MELNLKGTTGDSSRPIEHKYTELAPITLPHSIEDEARAAFNVDPYAYMDSVIDKDLNKAQIIYAALRYNQSGFISQVANQLHFVFESDETRRTALRAVNNSLGRMYFANGAQLNENNPSMAATHFQEAIADGCIRTITTLNELRNDFCHPLALSASLPGYAEVFKAIEAKAHKEIEKIVMGEEELDEREKLEAKAFKEKATAAYQFGLLIKFKLLPSSVELDIQKPKDEKLYPAYTTEMDYFFLAAEMQLPEALCELGKYYLDERNKTSTNSNNKAIGETYLYEAASLGSEEASQLLDDMHTNGTVAQELIFAYFVNRAKRESMNSNGGSEGKIDGLHAKGRKVAQSLGEDAMEFFEATVDDTQPAALYRRAMSLLAKNPESTGEAITLLNKARNNGYSAAAYQLSVIYGQEGKYQDRNWANFLLSVAVKAEYPDALFREGELSSKNGITEDAEKYFRMLNPKLYPTAALWLANQNLWRAKQNISQQNLSTQNLPSINDEQNSVTNLVSNETSITETHRFLSIAANAGIAEGWLLLGKFYVDNPKFCPENRPDLENGTFGRDVLIDNCFKNAIAKGSEQAKYELSLLYRQRICSYELKPPFKTPFEQSKDLTLDCNFGSIEPRTSDRHSDAAEFSEYLGYSKAEIDKLQKAADAGYPDAMFRLGYYLIHLNEGKTLTKKIVPGEEYLVQAANHGHPEAMEALCMRAAEYYMRAKEFFSKEEDQKKAIRFYSAAIELKQEIISPEFYIAEIYEDRKEMENAIHYYQLASRKHFNVTKAEEALVRLGVPLDKIS